MLEVESRHGWGNDWWVVRYQGFGEIVAWFCTEDAANEYVLLKAT